MNTLIISGGDIDDVFASAWIQANTYDRMMAVDKGMEFFYRNGFEPDVIVGDFDSVSTECLEYYRGCVNTEIITLNPIKDDTDTEFAIRKAIRDGATHITLLGATGTRLDHVMGNIQLLGIPFEGTGNAHEVEIELLDAHNRVRLMDHSFGIRKETQFGRYVSLIPFTPQVKGLTLEGFRYPLQNATLKSFTSLGISNEIEGEVAKVKFDEGILLIIESTD